MARIIFFLAAVVLSVQAECTANTIQFGKYWTYNAYTKQGSSTDNTMYLFSPPNLTRQAPVVLNFHPGGFIGGTPSPECGQACQQFVDSGVHYASVGYRLTENEYFYCPDGSYDCPDTYKEAEFIHVDEDGALRLDTADLTVSNYSVVTGRYEYITQCQYDASQALEYLIKHSQDLLVDVHRVGLSGESAGGGEINYLAWVYHALHPERFTPVSLSYMDAQLNYPVGETLDQAWELWQDAVGPDVLVSQVIDPDQCSSWMGNPECSEYTAMAVCNQTWQQLVLSTFCGDNWNTTTIGDVRNSALNRWPLRTVQQRGMTKLWYTAQNLAAVNRSTPMYLYVVNDKNGTGMMDLPHSAIYARGYHKYAKQATGVNYAIYYTDYTGIKPEDVSKQRFDTTMVTALGQSNVTFNYQSNFDMFSIAGMSNVSRSGSDEQFLLHCHAFELTCSV